MKRQSWCCKFKQLVNCKIGSLEPVFVDAGLIFILHFTNLGVRTHPTDPPAYGPVVSVLSVNLTHLSFL